MMTITMIISTRVYPAAMCPAAMCGASLFFSIIYELISGLTTYLYWLSSFSPMINGFWLSTTLKISSSLFMILMKSVMYLPLIPKLTGLPSMIAGILVTHAHLLVLPDEMMIVSLSVSIWMKLLMSLVRIPIFLMAFSQRFLSTRILVLKFLGIISSLSYSGKFP